jgi:chromosome segregation ATPase
MAWVIKNISGGAVIISDLNFILHQNQSRDLDLLGRDIAEKSVEVRQALVMKLIEEVRKDPVEGAAPVVSKEVIDEMKQTTEKAVEAAEKANEALQKQEETIKAQEEAIKGYQEEQKETRSVLEQMKEMLALYPEETRAIKKAIEGIKTERVVIADKREELRANNDMSQAEIDAQERILQRRDERLEKNLDNMGESIKVEDADVQESMDALDELGLD